jgi:hypothetical protein
MTAPTINTVNFKVSLAQHSGEGANKKTFYYYAGKGVVFGLKNQEMIGFTLLPGVCISGGLVQVFKDHKVPKALESTRLDIKVQEFFEDGSCNYHTVGTLFPVANRNGMYSISLPEGMSLSGGFVVTLPAPKK